jgi:tRNA pseudouridine55 synthase
MKPVEVTIHASELLELSLPEVRFRLRCSSGTYVRAVARDLGRALGVGAFLTSLRRHAVGTLSVDDAVSLRALEDRAEWGAALLAPSRALSHLPACPVGEEDARRIRQGQEVALTSTVLPRDTPVRVLRGEQLVAIGYADGPRLRPRKVLGTAG